jgi:hypothetical protein
MLVLTSILLFQQCGGNDQTEERNNAAPQLTLILNGEAIATTEIDAGKSKLMNQWVGKILEDKSLKIEPEEKRYVPDYILPYSWLPLRCYLEDLRQFELYTQVPARAIGPQQKEIVIPSSWEEFDLEDASYPLVRKWLVDSYGVEGKDRFDADANNYNNPFYQKLEVTPVIKDSKYAAPLNLYNLLLVKKIEEEPCFAQESAAWRGALTSTYLDWSKLLVDRLHPLLFGQAAAKEAPLSEEEIATVRRQEILRLINGTANDKLVKAFAQLAQQPLPADLNEEVDALSQQTQEYATSLAKKAAELQVAYDTTMSLLSVQEQQLFQQIFVHCKEVEQSQQQLMKRLAPYRGKDKGKIAMLSLIDILEAIDQILQSDQKGQYSKIESSLYEIRANYYQRVRQVEAAF